MTTVKTIINMQFTQQLSPLEILDYETFYSMASIDLRQKHQQTLEESDNVILNLHYNTWMLVNQS